MLYFLNGFMGSGKTHWGRIWAAAYHMGFVDLDEVITMEARQSVVDIFEDKGEDYFRELEARKLREFGGLQHTIISCGGGTPCYHDNLNWMKSQGITVYLEAKPEEILRRLIRGQEQRPLIKKLNQAELLFFIEQKLQERESFYRQCDVTLTTGEVTETIFAEKIISFGL